MFITDNVTPTKALKGSGYTRVSLVFLSHLLGRHSTIANFLSKLTEMLLNIVLAAVCIGYIAGLLSLVFASMTMGNATMVAFFLLACALPFELLNTVVQNGESQAAGKPEWVQRHPLMTQLIGLMSTILGAVQYLIRNFNLVKNFGTSQTGAKFLRQIRQSFNVYVSATQFAVFGGLVGFLSHVLLSYGNWDKFVELGEKEGSKTMLSNAIWLVGLALLLSKAKIGVSHLRPLGIIAIIGYAAIKMLTLLPLQSLKQLWQKTAVWTLPLGALLYTLVDFFNSYHIVESLGLLSPVTIALCGVFGLFSWFNVMLVWGYNMVRSTYDNRHVDLDYPSFVSLYYSDASVRRVFSYVKELLLCGIDILNNQLSLEMINYILLAVSGVTVNLFMLNFCTCCYALNRLVVLYFQSSDDKTEYVSKGSYNNTPVARVCNYVCSGSENKAPKAQLKV